MRAKLALVLLLGIFAAAPQSTLGEPLPGYQIIGITSGWTPSACKLVRLTGSKQLVPKTLAPVPQGLGGSWAISFLRDGNFGFCSSNFTSAGPRYGPPSCGFLSGTRVSWPGKQPSVPYLDVVAFSASSTATDLYLATTNRLFEGLTLSKYNFKSQETTQVWRLPTGIPYGVSFSATSSSWGAIVQGNNFALRAYTVSSTGRLIGNQSIADPSSFSFRLSAVDELAGGRAVLVAVGKVPTFRDHFVNGIFNVLDLTTGIASPSLRFKLPDAYATAGFGMMQIDTKRRLLLLNPVGVPANTNGVLVLNVDTGAEVASWTWFKPSVSSWQLLSK